VDFHREIGYAIPKSLSTKTDIQVFTLTDTLTGEDVVPGFACPVAQLFE